MYLEERDDTIIRPSAVFAHFRNDYINAVLARVRQAFKQVESTIPKLTSPLDFSVDIDFDRVLPDFAVKAIRSELESHGWNNYFLDTRMREDETKFHQLKVMLNHEEACAYVTG